MSDTSRIGDETETPVNPYSLLEAVNNSSDTAHMAWLIFLGLMAYLMIAIAGVTHKDLLLETPVALPILQVSIPQSQFFQFAPIMLVLLHVGVVSQLVLLARKTLEFDRSVRALEISDKRTHPLRLELHNFFFVQAVAGPHRSHIMSVFLHGMSWLTLVVLPVILLLFIQIRYLPYHDVNITWAHRVTLLADVGMLILIGVFLTRAETSFVSAFWRTTLEHPFSFITTTGLLAMVVYFSFFVATIPGEPLDRMSQALPWSPKPAAPAASAKATGAAGFDLPFLRAGIERTVFGVFHRNLVATDLDLTQIRDKDGRSSENAVTLRGRDLRFAKLDRTDFRGADLTNVDLDGASLVGADLTSARLQCADVTELYLSDNRDAARCVSARGANFSRAKIKDARLSGIDARGARFEEAILDGVDLSYGLLSGANFSNAHLERADLSGGTQLQGANFLIASLQGADLSGASLFMADFSSASMQGAVLSHADLQGALLRDTDLEAADLGRAKLQGADMTRAKLKAADLKGASIWMTLPPANDSLQLADTSELIMKPLEATDTAGIQAVLDKLDSPRLKAQIKDSLAPVMNLTESRKWAGSADQLKWVAMANAAGPVLTDGYKAQLTDYLGRVMCKARWSSGAVATGIAKRSLGQGFRGDMGAVYDKLRSKDCPASETVAKKTMRDLAGQVDIARGN